MERVRVIYEDRWGAIIDRVAAGHLELRWFDSTAEMSSEAYREWLAMFAEEVGTSRRPGVLVDATRFRVAESHEDLAWNQEHLVPRYNASGLGRLAVLVADGAPERRLTGEDGGAEFETAWFHRRDEALEWLAEAP